MEPRSEFGRLDELLELGHRVAMRLDTFPLVELLQLRNAQRRLGRERHFLLQIDRLFDERRDLQVDGREEVEEVELPARIDLDVRVVHVAPHRGVAWRVGGRNAVPLQDGARQDDVRDRAPRAGRRARHAGRVLEATPARCG
jgi:hypothetical protein